MRALALGLMLLLSSCTVAMSDDEGDMTVSGACEVAPELTWNTFGDGFLLSRCQHCHGSYTNDRYGAPQGVSFDTLEDVRKHRTQLLNSVHDEKIPPGGGLRPDEVLNLADWLSCDPCIEMSSPECELAASAADRHGQ